MRYRKNFEKKPSLRFDAVIARNVDRKNPNFGSLTAYIWSHDSGALSEINFNATNKVIESVLFAKLVSISRIQFEDSMDSILTMMESGSALGRKRVVADIYRFESTKIATLVQALSSMMKSFRVKEKTSKKNIFEQVVVNLIKSAGV